MLTLTNISKSINNNKILNNVSFTVDQDQIFGFLGPNGAGKTTTIRIILGLYDKYSGKIEFNDGSPVKVQKKNIGFMLEDDGLYDNLTLMENLIFYSDIYNLEFHVVKKTIDGLLSKFDLLTSKDKKVSTFSRGMKQKVSFIRSIIHNPKLLILDEPFNGLDPEMQRILRNYLLYLLKEKGTTIFFSSHNLYEVDRLCDKIAIIKDGEIKFEEFMFNLKNQSNNEDYNLEKAYFKYTNE